MYCNIDYRVFIAFLSERVIGGKKQISPDGGFYFLSKDLMLEYGLDSAFKERVDMATFAHETLVSQLDWTLIQQCLRDFEQVFLQHPKVTDDGDEPESLIETFLYLITLVSPIC